MTQDAYLRCLNKVTKYSYLGVNIIRKHHILLLVCNRLLICNLYTGMYTCTLHTYTIHLGMKIFQGQQTAQLEGPEFDPQYRYFGEARSGDLTLQSQPLGGRDRWDPFALCLASLAELVSFRPVRDLVSKTLWIGF